MAEILGSTRKEALKAILRRLHDGESPSTLKQALRAALGSVSAAEIARIEQELVAEGLPRQELMRLCDLHLSLFEESLGGEELPVPDWHPLRILMIEHQEVLGMANRLASLARQDMTTAGPSQEVRDLVHHLVASESHYVREENVLFPYLERYGVVEPPRVMWAEHDQIRMRKKAVVEAVDGGGSLAPSSLALSEMLASHFMKENRILFPTALRVIPEVEWPRIRAQFDELGYCCFTPLAPPAPSIGESTPSRDAFADHQAGPLGSGAPQLQSRPPFATDASRPGQAAAFAVDPSRPAQSATFAVGPSRPGQAATFAVDPSRPAQSATFAVGASQPEAVIRFATGELTPRELQAMLDSLPIDITFVDKDDRVRYFSQGRERIFVRMPAIIGRRVQDCHPQKSVHVVEQIVADFRSGRREMAEFWIPFEGKLVHIRYYPVRAPDGEYLGVVEVTQDITRARQLEGEKRLLDEAPTAPTQGGV